MWSTSGSPLLVTWSVHLRVAVPFCLALVASPVRPLKGCDDLSHASYGPLRSRKKARRSLDRPGERLVELRRGSERASGSP